MHAFCCNFLRLNTRASQPATKSVTHEHDGADFGWCDMGHERDLREMMGLDLLAGGGGGANVSNEMLANRTLFNSRQPTSCQAIGAFISLT